MVDGRDMHLDKLTVVGKGLLGELLAVPRHGKLRAVELDQEAGLDEPQIIASGWDKPDPLGMDKAKKAEKAEKPKTARIEKPKAEKKPKPEKAKTAKIEKPKADKPKTEKPAAPAEKAAKQEKKAKSEAKAEGKPKAEPKSKSKAPKGE